jgi:hypothetical protein
MGTIDIWENGIPLPDAPTYFASRKLRQRYDSPQAQAKSLGSTLLSAQTSERSNDEKLRTGFQQISNALDNFGARLNALSEMRGLILWSLTNGKLSAYGFTIPRKIDDLPQKIPNDLFQKEFFNWGKSSIKGAGLEFTSVRIVDPRWIKSDPSELENRRPPGRPTSKIAISAAIKSLIGEKRLPNTNSRKSNIELVRARVHELFPDQFPGDKGLKRETIGKYLLMEFPN